MNHRKQTLFESFNNAISGLIRAVKIERNMKIHLVAGVLAVIFGFLLDLSLIELMILSVTITIVITLELVNTAIEKTIDLVTNEYHPLARLAKDIGAGAVFVAALNAVIVGWLLFGRRLIQISLPFREAFIVQPADLIVLGLGLSFFGVLFFKGVTKAKSPLLGGLPSGHSALAFGLATAIYFYSDSLLISLLGFILAFMVAQSRVQGKIHNLTEVIAGSLLGIVVMALVFFLKEFWHI